MAIKGLYLNKEGNALDKATLGRQELKLLASGDGVEIMIQEIDEGIPFDICPDDENLTLMEFFYILTGELEYMSENGNVDTLKSNDYFYVKELTGSCLFKTKEKTKLLYVSSQPIFHYLGESLNEVNRMNREIDQKDKYTHGHSERVRDYSLKISLKLGIDRERMINILLGALFHDVGKINIPDEILQKPDNLTDEEFEIMKQHPTDGANLVKKIKYTDISSIVAQHHERIDGSGYPNGLKGDEICLEARIVAVADAYDTMTSNRPYRNALTVEQAVNELLKHRDTQYDARVIDALIEVLKSEYKI